MEDDDSTKQLSIYGAARTIKRRQNISQLWSDLPLLANLRSDLWYFFCLNWVGQKIGCFIVDATRKGKRFPDSVSKTIPIWTCVLNRAIYKHLKKDRQTDLFNDEELSTSGEHSEDNGQINLDWDCSLHLPLWLSEKEKASIEDRLDEWTQRSEASGADVASLASLLKKPLHPLWISQKTDLVERTSGP